MPKSPVKKKAKRESIPVQVATPVVEQIDQPVVEKPTLPVVYKELSINERSTASPKGPLTPDVLKKILGWETEKDFQQRMVREKGGKPEQYGFGDVYHCLNDNKEKVYCWNNANNRPFDIKWCESLVYTILQGQWAGPFTLPGETVNGEAIRVSRHGRVLSGQHQATACILANERLQKDGDRADAPKMKDGSGYDTKYPFWNGQDQCFIETILVTGMSEHELVLQSIDYVKPRSLADMLYTLPLFREKLPVERKEMTRMLAAATDLLWERTKARGYKTHIEMAAFLERHQRLLDCVEYLFIENRSSKSGQGRLISKLRISAGQAAAICYLMGSSGPSTDGDDYRNGNPPTEKGLDWSYWNKAKEFWASIGRKDSFLPIRLSLANLIDSTPDSEENQGNGGRLPEKLAVIAAAWEIFREHSNPEYPPFTDDDLVPGGSLYLSYTDVDDKGNKLPNGQVKLINIADFYGIDCPEVRSSSNLRMTAPEPTPPTKEEIEKMSEEVRAQRPLSQRVD